MEFNASLDSLDEIMLYIREQANAFGVEPGVMHKVELACEEAVVNIISYAYRETPGRVEVLCEKNGNRFEITFCDQGIEFNPIDVDVNPQFNTPVQKRKVGGMGIFLIRKIIDEVSYQREGEKNILRLVFNLV